MKQWYNSFGSWMLLLMCLAAIPPAQAATATLSGATGSSCAYASITVTAAGSAVVHCQSTPVTPQPPTPPQPPAPPPGGCTVSGTERSLAWGQVLELRQGPGAISWFRLPPPREGKHSVTLTQGQQPSTPAGVITELSVSKCPGRFETQNPYCYRKSPYSNNNSITAYTSPVWGWDSQAKLAGRGCWAPSSEGQWYVSVRWTYSSCSFGSGCGFSMQWDSGSY